MAGAGDVNGDGFADIVVGAANADPNGISAGESSWSTAGEFLTHFQPRQPDGRRRRRRVGRVRDRWLSRGADTRPAAIGDINGDGFTDIRVGAETDDPSGLTDAGRAFIVYGRPSPSPVTRFYVVNDAATDRTYEYTAAGNNPENSALTAVTPPRAAPPARPPDQGLDRRRE